MRTAASAARRTYRTRIIEHFTWRTRTGAGINVFDEGTFDCGAIHGEGDPGADGSGA